MSSSRSSRTLASIAGSALAIVVLAASAIAQGQPNMGLGPTTASNDPIEAARRRWVGERLRNGQLDYFVDLARSATDPAQRTLAYAVLLQGVRNPRAPAALREKVTPVLDAAWADAALAPKLVDAITLMRVESQYAEQLKAYRAKAPTK